jgi:hypothetical protein
VNPHIILPTLDHVQEQTQQVADLLISGEKMLAACSAHLASSIVKKGLEAIVDSTIDQPTASLAA